MYISSNWSTGAGGCENYTEFFQEVNENNPLKVNTFEYKEEVKTHHEQLVTSIPIPELKIQVAIDLPDSELEEDDGEEDNQSLTDEKNIFSHLNVPRLPEQLESKIGAILQEVEGEDSWLA